MNARIESLNRALKAYDRYLYAERSGSNELVGIYRRNVRWETYDWYGDKLSVSRSFPDPVMYLTDNWTIFGKPIEWGIEPVMARLRFCDGWTHDPLEEVNEHNDRIQKNQERAFGNEVRARAADMRKDFAKAVNDINTSSLEKVDNRRMKDGTCK